MKFDRKEITKELDKLFNLLNPPKDNFEDSIGEFVFAQTTKECFSLLINFIEENFSKPCNDSSFNSRFITSTKEVKLGNLFKINNPKLIGEDYFYLPEHDVDVISENYTFVWDYDINNKIFLSKEDYSCPYQSTTWFYLFVGMPDEYKIFRRLHISQEVKENLNKINNQMETEKILYCLKRKEIKIIL